MDGKRTDHLGPFALVCWVCCTAAGRHPSSRPHVFVVSDQPELKHVDRILLKQMHTAATTFILEAVKQNADRSTIRWVTLAEHRKPHLAGPQTPDSSRTRESIFIQTDATPG